MKVEQSKHQFLREILDKPVQGEGYGGEHWDCKKDEQRCVTESLAAAARLLVVVVVAEAGVVVACSIIFAVFSRAIVVWSRYEDQTK